MLVRADHAGLLRVLRIILEAVILSADVDEGNVASRCAPADDPRRDGVIQLCIDEIGVCISNS